MNPLCCAGMILAVPLLSACTSAPFPAESGEYVELVPAEGLVEVGIAPDGHVREVEFHIRPSDLPAPVRRAAEVELGEPSGAEIEYHRGQLYYEVTGRNEAEQEIEVLFRPDGTIHGHEIAVGRAALPDRAVRVAREWRGDGEITSWEEIRNAGRVITEYHAKKTIRGRHYKLVFGQDGALVRAYRETTAEVEIPVE